MDQIRHTYLHYEVEPLVYARAAATDRLLPLLKTVQNAPIEFNFKSDIVALMAECLIKAIEAQTMDVGIPKPKRPDSRERIDQEHFDAETAAYDKQAEAIRRKAVELSVRQGWVLVDYLYDQLGQMGKESISLKDNMGQMIYGMDVQREHHKDSQIVFLPEAHPRRRPPRPPPAQRPRPRRDEAHRRRRRRSRRDGRRHPQGQPQRPPGQLPRRTHPSLIQGDPDDALEHLNKTLTLAKDPRTLAWTHIYLGRLYDIARDPKNPHAPSPERPKNHAENKAPRTDRHAQPDTKAAAEKGIKEPFTLPKRAQPVEPDSVDDPSGKAEKDAYRPPPPSK